MNDAAAPSRTPQNWVAALTGFVGRAPAPGERCELCGAGMGERHDHLIEPESRHVLCACTPCALLFASLDARRYRRVPVDVVRLPGFRLTDAQWDAMLIPINLAFFYRSSPAGRVVAMYPGPAGATESLLDLTAWQALEDANPVLRELQPDVEALLVNRTGGARDCWRVPMDRCFELVGMIRKAWHGLSGGEEVRRAVRQFFAGLDDRRRH